MVVQQNWVLIAPQNSILIPQVLVLAPVCRPYAAIWSTSPPNLKSLGSPTMKIWKTACDRRTDRRTNGQTDTRRQHIRR